MERKFYKLSKNIFKIFGKCSYEAEFTFFWRLAESKNKLHGGSTKFGHIFQSFYPELYVHQRDV